MQPREAQRRVRPEPRRHRPDEAPGDGRVHAEEPQLEPAVSEQQHLAPHAEIGDGGAGGEVGWVGGGEEEEAGVEDGESGGGGDDGEEGALGDWGGVGQ